MQGRSLHIGLDFASSQRWGRLAPPLPSPAGDAKAFAGVAAARKFAVTTLVNEQATLGAVRGAIADAARELRDGDSFVLTFSGHGLAATTRTGFQQSWCLFDDAWARFDRSGLDAALTRFASGVRILIVVNCCFASPPRDAIVRRRFVHRNLVRIGSSTSFTIASSSRQQLSPFVRRFIDVLAANDYHGFHGFFRELTFRPIAPMMPKIEIAPRCSKEFLRVGPFRL
jgi:hypothetical protein